MEPISKILNEWYHLYNSNKVFKYFLLKSSLESIL